MPHVLLCERDPLLAKILVDVFEYEQMDVTECGSLADIESGLIQHPGAVVVTDTWTDGRHAELSEAERESIIRLSQRAALAVTTARPWASKASDLDLLPGIRVIPKPYDLDELLEFVRAADSLVRSQ